MDTEELYEDRAHGLLAIAFDDDVPVVNLVPGAVDGFRRHRRRTRVLGTTGGALALAGVIAAGTVAFGGSPADQSSTAGGQARGLDKCNVPESVAKQAGWDAAMVRTVTENCTTNVALIEHAIPGAKVEPATPTSLASMTREGPNDPVPTTKPDTRFYPVIGYAITVHGRTAFLTLMVPVLSRNEGCGYGCTDTTLFGGMRAKEYSGPDGSAEKDRIDMVLAFPSSSESFYASVSYAPGAPEVFDFHAFSHSPDFTKLVNGSAGLLSGEKYAGYGYIPVS